MAATFEFCNIGDGLRITIRGVVTLDDIRSIAETVNDRSSAEGGRLWDAREVKHHFTHAEVRELAEAALALLKPTCRVAILVGSEVDFGLVRMFEVYREEKGVATRVFRAEAEAVAWLTAPRLGDA